MNTYIARLKWLLVASAVSSSAGLAAPTPATSHFRMQRSADIERVLVNSQGQPFALLLAEGSIVMLSSHASELGFAPGQRVQVEGDAVETALNIVYYRVRLTRGGKLLQAADEGPARQPVGEECAGDAVTRRGSLEALLAAPDGRITGMVFANGTLALATPSQALDVAGLTRGAKVDVSGPAGAKDGTPALRIERLALR